MAARSRYLITAEELGLLTRQTVTRVFQEIDQQQCIKLAPGILGVPPHLAREYLRGRGVDYTSRVIAHFNLKGGTGKTTTTITAATRAAQYGFRTCILDMDPQGSASLAFNVVPKEDDQIFCDVWEQPSEKVIDALRKLDDSLYILPSSLENETLNTTLFEPELQKQAVRGVCDVLRKKGFDLIMIDCPPSIGTHVISSICAANIVVIPVCSDAYSRRGIVLTLQEIASVCQRFQRALPRVQILYTRFDKRLKISTQVLQTLIKTYRKLFIPTPIGTSSEFAKALENRETVFASLRKNSAKDDYDQYVRYLLKLDGALEIE